MTAYSSRRALRAFAVTAAALGAVLAGGTAAVADSNPTPKVEVVKAGEAGDCRVTPTAKDKSADKVVELCLKQKVTDRKDAVSLDPAVTPRGGVAAGEQPVAEQGGTNSTALVAGSAIGALGLAAAGTVVLRRRAAHGDAR
ncbi:hypothetical protein ACFXG1_02410 [Streptomyces sp. NPDC059248]|uniref:hypothetical protein n=1 Tax=Streptomyces sp. NPDC059248 TaxID=3346791 RepID=UPI0036CEF590